MNNPVASTDPTWPQIIEVDGLKFMARAPINPRWKAGLMAHIWGKFARWLYDPSNGWKCNPPQPIRSAAGFPLQYALGYENYPQGVPSIMHDGMHFLSDSAVLGYISSHGDHAQAVTQTAGEDSRYYGPIGVHTLKEDDKKFMWWWVHQPGETNWPYKVLNGTHLEIAQLINSFTDDPGSAYLRTYDHTTYHGVLLPYIHL